MKNTNLLEKIGFGILLVGLVLLLTDSLTENENILNITRHNEIFHWVGLGIWAIGYFQREKKINND